MCSLQESTWFPREQETALGTPASWAVRPEDFQSRPGNPISPSNVALLTVDAQGALIHCWEKPCCSLPGTPGLNSGDGGMTWRPTKEIAQSSNLCHHIASGRTNFFFSKALCCSEEKSVCLCSPCDPEKAMWGPEKATEREHTGQTTPERVCSHKIWEIPVCLFTIIFFSFIEIKLTENLEDLVSIHGFHSTPYSLHSCIHLLS
jgi:hypothetical protein